MEARPLAGAWSTVAPPLRATTLAALERSGFTQMTPVQAGAIPLFLTNKDVVAEAVTGSGKTLAFLVPVVEILLRRETPLGPREVGAIVIEPTRELAKQVADVLEMLLEAVPSLPFLLLTGGNSLAEDVAQFRARGAAIVVATPGRLDDIMTKVAEFSTRELDVLVLDEADRLLDMGFERTISSILTRLPKQRRTGLFSATMTDGVTELVRAGLRNAVRITVKVERVKSKESQRTPTHLTNRYLVCESDQKLGALLRLLAHWPDEKAIVYFATCACVDFYGKALEAMHALGDRTVVPLHGKMEQKKRTAALSRFASSVGGVLLCTDVAARGLDIPDVDFVIQYDPPQDPNGFVHRCGRTARLGKEGHAVLLLLPTEDAYVEVLRQRKAPLSPLVGAGMPADLAELERESAQLKEAIRHDRDLLDKSLRGFVSFIRSYKEHVCSFIFRLRDLNFERLARAFGLFRLPRMPELRDMRVTIPTDPFNTDLIPYRDKVREKLRKKLLREREQVAPATAAAPSARPAPIRPTAAWSNHQERKRKREERQQKRARKRAAIAAAKGGNGGDAGVEDGDDGSDDDGSDDGASDGQADRRAGGGAGDDAANDAGLNDDAEHGSADEEEVAEGDAAELDRDYRKIKKAKRRARGGRRTAVTARAFADLA